MAKREENCNNIAIANLARNLFSAGEKIRWVSFSNYYFEVEIKYLSLKKNKNCT